MTVRIIVGDVRAKLRDLPDASIHCCVTSPPYFGLRDYGMGGQIGLETTPEAYVAEMVAVFREVRRVLRKDGTVWLNLGDSYASGETGRVDGAGDGRLLGTIQLPRAERRIKQATGLPPKNLLGIPWRVAFALQADDWYLRQDIIWAKPNPMPESVTDRCTKAHEYMFLLAKSERYYFDAEAIAEDATARRQQRLTEPTEHPKAKLSGANNFVDGGISDVRNKRSVWEVATQPFSEAHFATFPPALIEPCIKAGCPAKVCGKCGAPWMREIEREVSFTSGSGKAGNVPNGKYQNTAQAKSGSYDIRMGPVVRKVTTGFVPSCACNANMIAGTVLDPFGGAGTTGLVADRLGRNAVLIELNPEYAALAERRIHADAGLFASLEMVV